MTLIVGVAVPGQGAIIGSDSMGSDGHRTHSYAMAKIYQPSPAVAFGFTTSWRFGQVLGHHAKVSFDIGDEFDWLVEAFVPAMREALSEHGASKKENEVETGGTIIVGVHDRVFEVQNDFGVLERSDGLAACGSGLDGALPAMMTARRLSPTISPKDLATIGLEVGAEYNAFVRPPWEFGETVLRVHSLEVA